MNKFMLNVRKIHRGFTIPMIILMILKVISTNTAYETIATTFTTIGMMFMVISGLTMYIYTIKTKRSKKDKPLSSH